MAVLPGDHQGAAEHTQNKAEGFSSTNKSKIPLKQDPLNLFNFFLSKPSGNSQSLSFTTESLNEFKLGSLEENPSEESDALSKAFESLGLGKDLQTLQEQCEQLEVTLQHTQEQLKAMTWENAQLKSQLRKHKEEQQTVTEQRPSKEKVCHTSCSSQVFMRLRKVWCETSISATAFCLPVRIITDFTYN